MEITVDLEDLRRVLNVGYPDAIEGSDAEEAYDRLWEQAFPDGAKEWHQDRIPTFVMPSAPDIRRRPGPRPWADWKAEQATEVARVPSD